jgi:multidrug efflux pump subunit AcrB
LLVDAVAGAAVGAVCPERCAFLVLCRAVFNRDAYGQIGLVILIVLAADNTILNEIAKRLREEGKPAVEAATEVARLSLQPILMTAFAFILAFRVCRRL